MSLAVLADLPAKAEQIAGQALSGRSIVVSGPTGSGRWSLADTLQAKLGTRGVSVSLPPFETHDAPLHGLVQAGAALGGEGLRIAIDAAAPLAERAARISELAARSGRVLLVRVPESWHKQERPNAAGRTRRQERAQDLLAGWLRDESIVGKVFILHQLSRGLLPTSATVSEVELSPPALDTAAFSNEERWGAYAPALRKVRECKGHENLSPIQLRLLVGVTALGERPEEIVPALWGGVSHLMPLLDRLVELLSREANEPLLGAVRRLARARFPLPREVALSIARCPAEHVPLLTECVAYSHGETLRVPDAVRTRLQRAPHIADVPTHAAIADHYRGLDGAPSPPADSGKILHWLERAHHVGRLGKSGENEWQSLQLAGPEQLLDHAWSLSVEFKDYTGAAALYRKRLEQDETDAYAWHYLGFNLLRANAARDAVESAFRRALDLEPNKPWWNSRLVTFLIRDLRYRKADDEWRSTIQRVDPKETAVQDGPWLARNVHRWVAEAWLDHGEIERARTVFRQVPTNVIQQDPILLKLRQRLEDAYEAVMLGESVYPAGVPMADRWVSPRVLPDEKDGTPLHRWMPGRILSVDQKTVAFVVALPPDRRVFKQQVTVKEWRSWSRATPRLDAFFEMGFYGADEKLVEVIEVRAQPSAPIDAPLEDVDDDPAEPVSVGAYETGIA
jgi:tetratricopeptide (TPR) repeat protein